MSTTTVRYSMAAVFHPSRDSIFITSVRLLADDRRDPIITV